MTRPVAQYPIDADLASMLPFELRAVPRIGNVDREVFDHVVRRADSPMVLEGVIDDWPALRSWKSSDRLEELVPRDETIYCRNIVPDPDHYIEDFRPHTWGELIDQVYGDTSGNGDGDLYLTQALVFEPVGVLRRLVRSSFPGLLQSLFVDCAVPSFIEPEEIGEGILWLGNTHQVTPLHFDPTANLNCTVMGRKRWILFPPDEARNLMVDNVDGVDCMMSSLDELLVDGRWRGGPVSRAFEVVTEPGDSLYLPAGWHHHVISPDEATIAVNFWFVALDEFRSYADYGRYLAIDRMGYRPRVKRRVFAAGIIAALAAARATHLVAPRLLPTPELSIGAATYDHTMS